MPVYTIHHRIDTLLELFESFEFDGFVLCAWAYDFVEGKSNGWLATKQIEADTVEESFRRFSHEFYRLVDRIAFVGQCHTTGELEPFLITKQNDNRFFWRYSKKRSAVPLHFQRDEMESLEALNKYEERGDVFRCLREAVNATSFHTMIAMLVAALEAIAGATNEKGEQKTNKEYIKNMILEDKELYDKIFKYGYGIRNQIFHGGFIDDDIHGRMDYNGLIFEKIVSYFNKEYGLKIDTKAVGRPRSLSGYYTVWSHWCEWMKDDTAITLLILDEKFNAASADEYYRSIEDPSDF